MDEVSCLGIAVMQKADCIFRVIGHQEIKIFTVKHLFLAFQGLYDPGDEIIQMLESKGACNKIPEKEL
jgi:hypothetical protein